MFSMISILNNPLINVATNKKIMGVAFLLLNLWLTWNKEHDACSKWAIEPLKSGEVSKGEDSRDDASKAGHGGKDHESSSGIPVS